MLSNKLSNINMSSLSSRAPCKEQNIKIIRPTKAGVPWWTRPQIVFHPHCGPSACQVKRINKNEKEIEWDQKLLETISSFVDRITQDSNFNSCSFQHGVNGLKLFWFYWNFSCWSEYWLEYCDIIQIGQDFLTGVKILRISWNILVKHETYC